MTVPFRTYYRSHPSSNVGNVVAKFGGRQATVRWDSALNADQNHRRAAEALMDRLRDYLGFRVTTGEATDDPAVYLWQAENPDNGPTEGYATYYTFRVAVECWNDHGTFDAIVAHTRGHLATHPDATDAELGQRLIDYIRALSDHAVRNQSLPRFKKHQAGRDVLAGLHHIDWDTVNAEDIGRQARQTITEENA